MPHTVKVKCNIQKKDVIVLNSFLDSYEGLGVVRTIDAKSGLVMIYATNDTYETVLTVLEHLRKDGVQIENIATQVSENVDEW